MVNELIKLQYNQGLHSNLFFWRENKGVELDIISEAGAKLKAMEVKSGSTVQDIFFKSLAYWNTISENKGGKLIYGDEESFVYKSFEVTSWRDLAG